MSSVEIGKLQRAYEQGQRTPLDTIDELYARIARESAAGVFIHLLDREQARAAAHGVMRRREAGESLLPFISF